MALASTFASRAITHLNKLITTGKIVPSEKVSLLSQLLLVIPKSKSTTSAEKDFEAQLKEIEHRAPVEVITTDDMNNMFELQNGSVNGSFVLSIMMLIGLVGGILYYRTKYGTDYTLNVGSLTGLIIWLLRSWRAHAIKKLTAILQQRAIDAAAGGQLAATSKKSILTRMDDVVLRLYGFGDGLSRLL